MQLTNLLVLALASLVAASPVFECSVPLAAEELAGLEGRGPELYAPCVRGFDLVRL